MTKNIYIISIILLSCIGLFLVLILISGIIRGNNFFVSGNVDKTVANIRKQEEYDLQTTNQLMIELIASDLNIILTDDNELKVIQYANKELENDKLFKVFTSDNTIKIREEDSNNIFWWQNNNVSSAYDIYLPKSYNKELTIRTISGEVIIDGDLDLEQLQINSTSGNIESDNIKVVNEFKTKTISGEIILTNIEANKVTIETTSGDVELESVKADSYIHSISGNIDLGLMYGSLDVATTSGDIKLNNYDVKEDSKITSISGNVFITFVPDTNCEIQADSVTGNISLPNGSNHIGNIPFNKVIIKTTSGNINLSINEDL